MFNECHRSGAEIRSAFGPPVSGDACAAPGRRSCVLQGQRGASPAANQDAGLICAPIHKKDGGMQARLIGFARRANADQEGAITLLTVFAVLVLTMLLGMVMNVGRHVDSKIRMQNAADASAYTGSVVLARGMNTLAFTNHLLSDVFALTAFLREARDRNSESWMPEILDAWDRAGQTLETSRFPKFERLGAAIQERGQLERRLAQTYGDWSAAASELILPVLEEILAEEMIPEFQRAVVEVYPDIAQTAAQEAARRNSLPGRDRDWMSAVLLRGSGRPVNEAESGDSTLPVVDPLGDGLRKESRYFERARERRDELAFRYLRDWNRDSLVFFDHEASQFSALWRGLTCGHLHRLLEEEYPDRNLPHMIRTELDDVRDPNDHMDEEFTFLAVVSRRHIPEISPGLFQNPLGRRQVTYAAARVFVPRRRLIWTSFGTGSGGGGRVPVGGVPGDYGNEIFSDPGDGVIPGERRWRVVRQNVPTQWDLFNQSWTAQLVPATQAIVPSIVQIGMAQPTSPPPEDPTPPSPGYRPNTGGRSPNESAWHEEDGDELSTRQLGSDDVRRISTH